MRGTLTPDALRRHWRGRRSARLVLAGILLAAAPVVAWRGEADAHGALVLAATRDLPTGHVLTPDDVRPAAVPDPVAPDGALVDSADAVGTRLSGAVRRGELLTDARLTGRPGDSGTRDAHRVVPVPLADPGVADLLEPGSLVDLVAPADPSADARTRPGDPTVPGDPTAPARSGTDHAPAHGVIARNAEVRDVPAGRPGSPRSILVEVPEADAARLAATAAGLPLAVLVHG